MRFGTKIMICVIVLLALTFGIGGSLLISASFDDALNREEEVAFDSYQLVLYTLQASGAASTYSADDMKDTLKQLDSQGRHSWEALRLSTDTETLYTSGNTRIPFSNELAEAADLEHCAMQITSLENGRYFLQITGLFQAQDEIQYLDSVFDISDIYRLRQTQQGVYQQLFAIIVAVAVGVSWLLSHWLTRPLRTLSRVTRRLASGNMSCRAHVETNDEIGRLAEDFNYMAGKLEENIEELKDSVVRQEEFMGNFAHELKTPMTSIIGYADLLRAHNMSEEEQRDAAHYIFNEGRRLEGLSLKLLDLLVTKKRDFTLEPGSPKRIIEDAVRLIAPSLYRQGIRLRTRCDDAMCLLEPDLIKSLILNLIDNARKALENGGAILVESFAAENGCVIRVTDNGRGIPEEALSKLTEAFYRVDKSRSRAQGGAGLGLSLCNEIAAIHGGELRFDSVLGKGTCVTVTLKGGVL